MPYPLTSKYKKTVLFIILLLAIVQIVVNFTETAAARRRTSIVHRIINVVTYPVQHLIYSIETHSRQVIGHYFFLVGVKMENERLQKSILTLQSKIDQLHEIDLENTRLRKLLEFRRSQPYVLLPAVVIGKDMTAETKTIQIDKGEQDGVHAGMAILSPNGVVGKVLEAFRTNSTVILISDPNSTIDVIVQRLRAKAIASGQSWNLLRFKYFEKRFDVKPGDVCVTSGLARIYPKGLTVGTITKVVNNPNQLFQDVELRPSVDFETVEEVLVLKEPPAEVPSEAEAAPLPSPAATQ